jgi:hypothetical protein
VVLPPGRRHGDVQRGAGAVRRRRGAAPGQSAGGAGRPGDPARPAAQVARGLPRRHVSGAPGWGLRQRQAVRVPGAGTGRIMSSRWRATAGWRSARGA